MIAPHLTEETAKKRTCPLRVERTETTTVMEGQLVTTQVYAKCLGSACQFWTWTRDPSDMDTRREIGLGFCGASQRP